MTPFSRAGIKFGIIPADRTEEVLELLARDYFTDEPITRSLGVKRTWIIDALYSEAIKGGSCVMATDTTGKIIGVRLTEVLDRVSWFQKVIYRAIIVSLPLIAIIAGLLRKQTLCKCCKVFHAIVGKLDYALWDTFDELGCQRILGDVCVCTSRESRLKGLGTELVKQAEEVGREKGCEYAVNIVTGLYSGKVFRDNCHYTVVKELFYSELVDKDGHLYLDDTREHVSCFSCYKKI